MRSKLFFFFLPALLTRGGLDRGYLRPQATNIEGVDNGGGRGAEAPPRDFFPIMKLSVGSNIYIFMKPPPPRFFRIMKLSLRLPISIVYDVENYFYVLYKLSENVHSTTVPLNELNSNP